MHLLCNKKYFLISVLKKRLERFKQAAARRMFDLIKSLKNHPKLSPFLGATDVTYEAIEHEIEQAYPNEK